MMPTPGPAPRLIELFSEAVELTTEEERAVYLDRMCGVDRSLRDQVEGLLRSHIEGDSFLESPAALLAATSLSNRSIGLEGPGTIIGPYELREPVGEGGMGVVYVAEQLHPVHREVALKVIKPGMDTKQVIARFEAERQALALLDHPNIAKIFDGGVTDGGRPYFVMELVRGLHITDYCDQERLPIQERLELFVLACRAVQHAHQKGIIHRDIKPSNILIMLQDGVPVPKVIDFGIAKATGPQSLTEKTSYTGLHQVVGTPLYMSPEQAELSGFDIDTRSDIYSLGVLLYELLTGTTPFDAEAFRTAAFDEIRRIIREQDPPKPSARLSSLGASQTTASTNRQADVQKLGRSIRGELDWIVMKALEKDRRCRYETASDFAADVMRYLTDKPVEACPPSARYRFAKFARRNRVALATAGLVALALIGGTVVSLWQAEVARHARAATLVLLNRAIAAEQNANARANESQRESFLQQQQRIVLTAHAQGWSDQAWDLVRRSAHLGVGSGDDFSRIQSCAVASLGGLDARPTKRITGFGARITVFDRQGHRLLMGSTTDPEDPSRSLGTKLWDDAAQELTDFHFDGQGPVGFRDDGTPIQLAADAHVGTLVLWDLAKRQVLHSFEVPGRLDIQEFSQLGMLSDGTLAAATVRAANGKVSLAIWDGKTGKLLHQLGSACRCVAFAPDGGFVAAGDESGHIAIWSLATGQVVARLDAGNRVNVVTFGPNPRFAPRAAQAPSSLRRWQLAAGDGGGNVTVWDLGTESPRVRSICQGSYNEILALSFCPDGSMLASAGRGVARLWDPGTGSLLLSINAGQYEYGLAFSPDGRRMVIGSNAAWGVRGNVLIVELIDGRGVRTLRGLSGLIAAMILSPDESLVVALSHDWKVGIWERESGRLKLVLDTPAGLYQDNASLAISPDNRFLAFSTHRRAMLWEIDTGRMLRQWSLPIGLQDELVFQRPDRLLLARAETSDPSVAPYGDTDPRRYPRSCAVYDLLGRNSLEPIQRFREANLGLPNIAFSPDGTILVVDGRSGEPGKVEVRAITAYDVASGTRRWSVPSRLNKFEKSWITFDPTGAFTIVRSAPDTAVLLDTKTGQIRNLDDRLGMPGPGAKLGIWVSSEVNQARLLERGRERPLLTIDILTTPIGLDRFTRNGRSIVGVSPLGDWITVCDLAEIQRRLAEVKLGW
jgi:serine/threonine protein kinase/WD40 repeat protein